MLGLNVRCSFLGDGRLCWLILGVLLYGFPVLAQSPLPRVLPGVENGLVGASGAESSAGAQLPDKRLPGSVSGRIVDQNGAGIAGARVRLTREDQSPYQETTTGEDGQFSFANIAPGPFHLTVTSEGFSTQSSSGILHTGEACIVPRISLVIATSITEVKVELSQIEIAQEQMNDEMKQRVLGVIPNFYVTYVPDAAPLTPKQKYHLAARLNIDPAYIVTAAAVAGVQQARNEFSGYGQGAQGYAKRFGATFGDFTMSNLLGNAVLPSLFKQDPRYFYKGTGTTKSRVLYALANAVICKGDNGNWQANYSGILGSLAAGGISNLYYPASDRGAALTFENTAIGIGGTAILNLMKEFVLTKITTNVPHRPNPANPNPPTN